MEDVRREYDDSQVPPKLAAVNVGIVDRFSSQGHLMTRGFDNFLYSPKTISNKFLPEVFSAYDKKFATKNGNKAILAFSEDVCRKGNNVVNVLIYSEPLPHGDGAQLLAESVSRHRDRNGLMSAMSPMLKVENDRKTVTTPAAFIKREKKLYFVADRNASMPLHYLYIPQLYKNPAMLSPWSPDFENTGIPHLSHSDYTFFKDLTDDLLRRSGVSVPDGISFYTKNEHNALRPEAREARKNGKNAYCVDEMSRNEIVEVLNNHDKKTKKANEKNVVKDTNSQQAAGVCMIQREDDGSFLHSCANAIVSSKRKKKSVVVQSGVRTPLIGNTKKLDYYCRVLMCPNQLGEAQVGASYAILGIPGSPISQGIKGVQFMFLDDLEKELKETYPQDRKRIAGLAYRIEQEAKETYKAIRIKILQEENLKKGQDVLSRMGVDVMVNSDFEPVIIEANGLNSGGTGKIREIIATGHVSRENKERYNDGYLAADMFADELYRQARDYQRTLRAPARGSTSPERSFGR